MNAKLDDEMVLMNIETSEYFGMNPTCSKIWEILEINMSVDQLIHRLLDIYEVDYETCQKDVTPVIQDMIERKFLISL